MGGEGGRGVEEGVLGFLLCMASVSVEGHRAPSRRARLYRQRRPNKGLIPATITEMWQSGRHTLSLYASWMRPNADLHNWTSNMELAADWCRGEQLTAVTLPPPERLPTCSSPH